MAIGLVELAATGQPDHLVRAQVILQAAGDLGFAQVRVAITVEQALLGGQQAALAVTLNTAKLGDQWGAVTVQAFDFEHFLGDLVVLVPRIVEATVEPTVGVELEVDAAHLTAAVVHHEASTAVAKPGVVAGHFHHPHLRRQHAPGVGVLGSRGADRDGLTGRDCADDIDPDFLRRLGTIAPYVRALGPTEPASRLALEFARQAETIGFGGGSERTCHGSTSCR